MENFNKLNRRRHLKSDSQYFKKLFSSTYWAGHRPELNLETEKILCKNRDLMAEKYKLKKYIIKDIPTKYHKDIIVYDFKKLENQKTNINNYPFLSDKQKTREYDKYLKEYIKDYSNFIDLRDHIEYYLTNDNKIASVFSVSNFNDYQSEYREKCGYTIIEPIYNLNQTTYIKLINTK